MCRRGRLTFAALGALTLGLVQVEPAAAGECAMPTKPRHLPTAAVVRVADGDTIVVETTGGDRRRVRLIGIDTPEVHAGDKLQRDAERAGADTEAIRALGLRASQATKKALDGRRVELERDVSAVDRHGRTLAYVWVGDQLLNLVLVRDGYASVLTVPPNVKHARVLAACHREARQDRRGLWALDHAAPGGR